MLEVGGVTRMDLIYLAKAAYEGYGKYTNNKNFRGDGMPEWDELPETIQFAWAAAAGVLHRLITEGAT